MGVPSLRKRVLLLPLTTHLSPVSALFFRNLFGPATESVSLG